MVERGIADPSVAGSNPVVPSFVLVVSCAVLWCNWLALWTLNPAIRVQIPVGPLLTPFRSMPPWLSWQSARLLTDRSLVRAQVEAPF